MFNTFIPRKSPNSWRQFNIVPTRHRSGRSSCAWGVWVYTDSDRMQGGGSRDGPLIVDPTQSVVVLMLYCHEPGGLARHEGVHVVRTATLVGYMTSTHTGQRILWDDWKRYVMVVETPPCGLSYVQPLVLGSRVLFTLYNREDSTGGSWTHVYDFSRWGCRAPVRAGDGENGSRFVPNSKMIQFPGEHDFGRVYWILAYPGE